MITNFKFIQNKITGKWVISAPKRAERPDSATGSTPVCPFCPGREKDEREVYRIGGNPDDSNWQIRVLPNKFPFAPIHEVIIHSPDHHKNFAELPASQVELILETYRQRYKTHQAKGQVYIFHNRGEAGGESLPHPHSQLAVIPENIKLDIPPLNLEDFANEEQRIETPHFLLFCPKTSQWPDEVWLKPKSKITRSTSSGQKSKFGDITDEEVSDLAHTLSRLIQIFNLRHGNEFPYNFYIYPGSDWYLRLIPRAKVLGGFEIGTGVFVNTTDPKDTLDFLRKNFQ